MIRISWWMRGGIPLDDCYLLDMDDRAIISDLIKENMESAKKSGMPFWQDYAFCFCFLGAVTV